MGGHPKRHNRITVDTIWEGALAAAKRTEEEVGLENLGPWSDFEWGMINGKLSALRWVMGSEWDVLDTLTAPAHCLPEQSVCARVVVQHVGQRLIQNQRLDVCQLAPYSARAA